MDCIDAIVAKDLARLRGNRKQAEIAKAFNADPSRISRIESAEVILSPDELNEYLRALGSKEAEDYGRYLESSWAIVKRPEFWHPEREILADADQVLKKLQEFIHEKSVEGPLLAQFELYVESLLRAVDFVQRRDHGMAFVGNIGVGKSTAICELTGLIIRKGIVDSDDLAKNVVLETNTGGATICESRVKAGPGSSYGIIVQPESMDEIFTIVGDLCYHLLGDQMTNGDDLLGSDGDLPPQRTVANEVEKALRNMGGLARSRGRSSDGKLVRTDPAADLADELGTLEKLRAEIFGRLNLPNRTQTEFWHDPISNESGLQWLKDTFSEINLGRRADVSLPKRIDVLIPKTLFDHKDLSIEVIDTKGVDGTAIRADIEGYIDDERTVAVLCTTYKQAPDPSIHGLIEHLIQRGGDVELKNSGLLMVLVHGKEALGTKDDSGELASNAEESYLIKQDQIESKLADINIDGLPIVFFNATSDSSEDVSARILEVIEKNRQTHVQQIHSIGAAIERLINNYEEAKEMAADGHVRDQLAIFLGEFAILPNRIRQPYQSLLQTMAEGHPSTLWACTRRNGNWWNMDAYHLIGSGTAIEARLRTREPMDHLRSIVTQMLLDPELEAAQDLLTQIKDSSEVWITEFLTEARNLGREIYRSALYDDDVIWEECTDLYGQGYGYRSRVTEKIREWCEEHRRRPLVATIDDHLCQAWEAKVIGRLRQLVAPSKSKITA